MIKLLQLLVAGVALGSVYGLVAMGFVVIYKSTKIINFAHGAVMVLGAYLVYQLSVAGGVPWTVAIALAALACAALGVALERTVLRRMLGRPPFAIVMVTFGVEIMIRTAVDLVWGGRTLSVGEPWGSATVSLGQVTTPIASLWTIGVAAVCVTAVLLFFSKTRFGLQMQATASDQEAALICGIRVSRVFAVAWIIGGVLAVLGGVFSAVFPRSLSTANAALGLRAFPAAIIGGLDSLTGAVVGGMILGCVEVLLAGYQTELSFLGTNFAVVGGYVVMLLVLLVRPTGLFGSEEVVRA